MGQEKQPLYLDYNATTPLDPRVFDAMRPWLLAPSNAGSRTHSFGQAAKAAVQDARETVAGVLNVQSEDIIFTSGATESNNLAILGLAAYGERTGRRHILSTQIEHKAVLEPLERLSKEGFEVELVPVCEDGAVDPDAIGARLRPDTLLVTVMHANNETGVLQPIEKIATILENSKTLLHTDAAQTFGKEVESLRRCPCDMISMSAHKVYGPQGVGALYVRRRDTERPVKPLIVGGGQERGLRSGTVPVPLVVGFGTATALAASEHSSRREEAMKIRQTLLDGLRNVEYRINGDLRKTQPHVLNVTFPGVDSEALMMAVKSELAFSNGSACTSSSYDSSHVLLAMGLSEDAASESIRLSWGVGVSDIDASILIKAVERTRVLL